MVMPHWPVPRSLSVSVPDSGPRALLTGTMFPIPRDVALEQREILRAGLERHDRGIGVGFGEHDLLSRYSRPRR